MQCMKPTRETRSQPPGFQPRIPGVCTAFTTEVSCFTLGEEQEPHECGRSQSSFGRRIPWLARPGKTGGSWGCTVQAARVVLIQSQPISSKVPVREPQELFVWMCIVGCIPYRSAMMGLGLLGIPWLATSQLQCETRSTIQVSIFIPSSPAS